MHWDLVKPVETPLAQYLRERQLAKRVQFLTRFERDFKRAVNVLTQWGRDRLVVFIDDLDRCSPPRPAEIMEALNLLLNAQDFIFVIGMDSQATATAIEAKYPNLQLAERQLEPGAPGFGTRFLEKFVQINFHLPAPSESRIRTFISAMFASADTAFHKHLQITGIPGQATWHPRWRPASPRLCPGPPST
ncbi:MAG: P-loop NTPase fold protein, partial [Candidatus Saccharimonadales bacterium]